MRSEHPGRGLPAAAETAATLQGKQPSPSHRVELRNFKTRKTCINLTFRWQFASSHFSQFEWWEQASQDTSVCNQLTAQGRKAWVAETTGRSMFTISKFVHTEDIFFPPFF